MKLTVILCMTICLNASARVYAQKVNLNETKASLETVFKKIKKQTSYTFVFTHELIKKANKVNVDLTNASLEDALKQIFADQPLNYTIYNNIVVIKDKPVVTTRVIQQVSVNGLVRDSKGEPMVGVSVRVPGTSIGTQTDANGKFQLNVPDGSSILFSFIGYIDQTVKLNGQTTLNITLEEQAINLHEVVAVGYGTQRRSDITGASSTVSAKEVAKRPLTRVEQALQGTTTGVAVTSQNGNAGSAPSVIIRGVNTITGGTTPLYVIDGNIGSGSDVNPSDIESIEVLKDAASTAIYGSRASNGVILITTKSGVAGKARVNFEAWFQKAKSPKKLDLMDAYDFARSVNNQFAEQGSAPAFTQAQLDGFKANGGTDWQDAVHAEPWVQNYQTDVSGGNDNVTYRVSLGYLNQPGIIVNQWYHRTSFRANVNAKLNDKMDLRIIVDAKIPQSHNNNNGGGLTDPWNQAVEWDPTSPIRNPDGSFIPSRPYASIQYNPVAQALSQAVDQINTNLNGEISFNYRITKDLTFTSNDNYYIGSNFNQQLQGPGTSAYNGKTDFAQIASGRSSSYLTSNYLTYKKTLGDHSFTVTALYEQESDHNVNVTATSKNLSTYALGYYNLALGATQQVASGYGANALISYLGRINYSYKDKYFLSASIRDDGSSHLTKKYSSFPSVGLRWNIIKEDFMKNSSLFSDLDIRATYGQTGNQAVGAYSSIAQITTGGNPSTAYYYAGGAPGVSGTGSNATFLGSPAPLALTWETKATYDAGIDMSFLKGRLTFVADGYTSKVTNLLYAKPNSAAKGGGNIQNNIGSISNKGLDLSLGGTPIVNSHLKWTTNLTFSMNRNKILDLGGLNNIVSGGATNQNILKLGRPLGEFYGFKFLGTWKSDEATQAALYGSKPGDAKYLDVNGDHTYTSADYVSIGNATPQFTFGFINDVTYDDFTLSFMFQGTHGNQIFSQTMAYLWGGLGDMKNATIADAVPENLWTPSHQTDNPAWSNTGHNYNLSSRYVYDASYVKLKNLSLSYHVPANLLKRITAHSFEIYVSGQNLFTITKYPGYDPEVQNGGNSTTYGAGQEFGVIPNPKTYTLGFRLGL